MRYRDCNLASLKSDHVRQREAQDWGMLRRVGYMIFWAAAVCAYASVII